MTFSWSPAVKEPLESDIWAEKFDDFMRNWVVTGLAPSEPTQGDLQIATGICWINGWRVEVTANETYDFQGQGKATDDYWVYIELVKSGLGKINSVKIEVYTSAQTEDIRILIATVHYDQPSDDLSSLVDTRQYDPFETTLIRLKDDVSLSAWQHASDLSKIDGADLYGASVPYSALTLADSIVNADINTGAAIAYSKLNLTTSIMDADINASAAIAWTKINKATSNLNQIVTRDHGDLSGRDDHDHSLYARKGTAEEITQKWTYSAGIDINQSPIDFYDETQQRGRFVGYGGEMRIWTKDCDLRIQDMDKTYASVVIETAGGAGGVDPDDDNEGRLGSSIPSKRWSSVEACDINEHVCSYAPRPTNAFEILALQKYLIIQGMPDGKMDSKNWPASIASHDRETGKRTGGRNVGRALDWLIFAMGDIQEKFDAYEERIATLELAIAMLSPT